MDRLRIYREEDDDGPAMWEPLSDSEDEYEDNSRTSSTAPPLLPVPSTLAKPGDALCSVCRALRLTPRQFVVASEDSDTDDDDRNTIQLGYVNDIKRKTRCPLCRLVIRALGPAVPDYEDGERLKAFMDWGDEEQFRVLKPSVQKEGGDFLTFGTSQLHVFPEITILANDTPTLSKASLPRLIKDEIDFSTVRNWTTMCENAHGSLCDISPMLGRPVEHPTNEIPSFRVIDVVDNCIVRAPHECRYVALSYVWGPIDPVTILRLLLSNVSNLQRSGGLLRPQYYNMIPQTIKDAMEVVRRLELRYLWVDSLCIIQDDYQKGGSKLDAISKMDLVYGAAFLTIMVSSGKDAHAGIPGLYPGTRGKSQPIEQISPGFRLAYKQTFQDNIPDEVYYTRGWTFQEQRFGTRMLIFTGGQAVFRCKRAEQWREDIVCEEDYDGSSEVAERRARDPDEIGQYEDLIRGYSRLALGQQSDVYHAFAGMARFFQMQLDVNLCHGIPDAFFDWFLLWTSHTPQSRRLRDKTTIPCSPTWSWAGWMGEAWPNIWNWYDRSVRNVRNALKERTWIIWYQRKAHNSEECTLVWNSGYSSSNSNFYGGRTQNRFPFDCSRTRPTSRRLSGAPVYYEDSHNPNPGSGYLQFWTVSVRFRLDEPRPAKLHADDFGPPLPGTGTEGPKNTRARVGIYGRNGRELGVTFVNPEWYRMNGQRVHEFILICEGRDEKGRGGRFDEEDGWKYKMMLIEWRGAWAERVGLGSIEKRDLQQALEGGPVWKEIILG